MAGDVSNIRVWESGDVYILDPEVTFDPETHIPANVDADLSEDWIPGGLMLGDPGVGEDRQVERTDVNSWQQGRVMERVKNPKSDLKFTLLEDNDVTRDLIDEDSVPSLKPRHVLVELHADNGYIKRKVSKAPVRLFVANNDASQDIKGREVSGALQPVGGKYWTTLEGMPD